MKIRNVQIAYFIKKVMSMPAISSKNINCCILIRMYLSSSPTTIIHSLIWTYQQLTPKNRSLPVTPKNSSIPVTPKNRSLPVTPKNRSNIFIFAYFHLILNETGPPCDENCCWQGLGSRLSSQNWDAGGFLDVTALICSRLA